jgi:opacity protein-like surface antigen
MWQIPKNGFSLQEVLIMAAMNAQRVTRLASNERGKPVAQRIQRRTMQFNNQAIKRSVLMFAGFILALSMVAVAQEQRSELSIEGTGFFTKDSAGNGVRDRATNTGGFLIGYRRNIKWWLAAEANYGYDHNTQMYFGNTLARLQSNIHQFTGSAVVKVPLGKFQPYVLAGGGALVFDPTGNTGGSVTGATQEVRGAFLYGVGADFFFTRHIGVRGEYRGLIYKAPDYNLARLNTDSWTNISQPAAGIVFGF